MQSFFKIDEKILFSTCLILPKNTYVIVWLGIGTFKVLAGYIGTSNIEISQARGYQHPQLEKNK